MKRKEDKPVKKKRSQNRQILQIAYLFVLLFCVLIGYYSYFLVTEGEEVASNPYNSARIDRQAERIRRGSILSSEGDVLAMTQTDETGEESRYYPYGNLFAQTVGYSTRGTTGIESVANELLLHCSLPATEQIYNELMGEKNEGDSVTTTLNLNLQQTLSDAMRGYTGAAVVLEPDTGRVLAMVSTPDFDPNTINQTYEDIIADDSNTNLLNKAAQGLYSPGSVFKLLTLLEYIRENPDSWQSFSYHCSGSIEVGGTTIGCSGGSAHGDVDAQRALELSCNGAFIEMGLALDRESFRETCEAAGFNQQIDFELPVSKSSFTLDLSDSVFQTAQTVFGQGETLVTPLHMAMIVSAIANNGTMCTPYVLERLTDSNGNTIAEYSSPSSAQIMTEREAAIISGMMEGVVTNGTAGSVQSDAYQAAAKTGSAQTGGDNETNAWFVGFAPAENPAVAIAIVLEEGGSGGTNAGPIAKAVFDASLIP